MKLKENNIYKLNKENISCVPNTPGNYSFYNKDRRKIYEGTTKGNKGAHWGPEPHQFFTYGIRHRVGSYIQKDDHREHPTKPALRREIEYFSFDVIRNDDQRREAEKRRKQGLKHNHL